MKYKLILLSVFLLYTNSYGADWIIKIDDGSKKKYDKLIISENDTLYAETSAKIIRIPIENIHKITHRGKYSIKSIFYGCASIYGGQVLGMIIVGVATHTENGLVVGSVVGAAAGYIYFRNTKFNKSFDLTQMSNEEKKDIINIIISKYDE